MDSFVHLHVHSHYSILDGMSSIPGLVDKAMALGMPAIALTDHGNMFGIKEFYNYVRKKNSKYLDQIALLNQELQQADLSEGDRAMLEHQLDETRRKLFKPILGCEAYVARRSRLSKDKDYIDGIIKENAEKANYYATKTLRKVQKKVGFPERIR